MKVIIPAAGFGSRLRPHTFTVPKSMLPVAGKPIIAHIIEQVISWGATEVTMVVGHLREGMQKYLENAFPIPFEFREQGQILGLGHAVLTGLNDDDGEVIVILGDTILEVDLRPVINRGITSIGVREVEDARKFGVVEKEGTKVVRMTEKSPNPPSNLAIVGIYYIRNGGMLASAVKEIIDKNITVKGEYQLTDALQVMIDKGEVIETFPIEGWFDCGKPATLLDTNAYLLKRDGGGCPEAGIVNSIIIPPVSIASQVNIENSIIGPNVTIGIRAIVKNSIISNSICGDDIIIESTVLKESLLGNRARVLSRENKLNIGASSELEI